MTLTFKDTEIRETSTKLHDRLYRAIECAAMAPSGHNTQPWKFRLLRDGVELYADRSRALPVVDPQDRELTISCGVALFYLQLAMHYDDLATLVHVLPDSDRPNLLARVLVSGPNRADDGEQTHGPPT